VPLVDPEVLRKQQAKTACEAQVRTVWNDEGAGTCSCKSPYSRPEGSETCGLTQEQIDFCNDDPNATYNAAALSCACNEGYNGDPFVSFLTDTKEKCKIDVAWDRKNRCEKVKFAVYVPSESGGGCGCHTGLDRIYPSSIPDGTSYYLTTDNRKMLCGCPAGQYLQEKDNSVVE
jgi:hypothetical protein